MFQTEGENRSIGLFRIPLLVLFIALLVAFNGCASTSAKESSSSSSDLNGTTRVVTDMMGRKVTIPKTVSKVISLSNNTTVDTYILAPDKLLGWSRAPSADAKPYIDDKYFNLPTLTTDTSNSANFENIIALKPDVIICSNEDEVYKPDELQSKLGIPVVYADIELNNTAKVYTFLGEVLGVQSRANKLADSTAKALGTVEKAVAKISSSEKRKIYYAEGTDWLQTDITNNVHAQVVDVAGGINVANIAEDKTGSMAKVSLEQVIAWNPDIILVGATAAKGGFYSKVYSTPAWSSISAVKNKQIYQIPSLPFNWFDRPPSAVRVLGVEWLANLLYPDTVKLDMKRETETYYNLFLHKTITDQQASDILNVVSSTSSSGASLAPSTVSSAASK